MITFAQVTSSKLMLGVEIQDFENVFNAHLRQGYDQYCCCDGGNKCRKNITALNSMFNCTLECETYFVVYLQDCTNETTCTKIKIFNFPENSPSDLTSLVFQIPFGQSTPDNQVWINFYLSSKESKLCNK